MAILFSDHALLKLNQRDLSEAKVLRTLKEPDFTEGTYSNRRAAYEKIGKLYLKVVFIEEGEDIVIITQHWDEKFRLPL